MTRGQATRDAAGASQETTILTDGRDSERGDRQDDAIDDGKINDETDEDGCDWVQGYFEDDEDDEDDDEKDYTGTDWRDYEPSQHRSRVVMGKYNSKPVKT